MLVRQVAERFGEKVKVVVENWGDSALAKRLGVTRYPAVFVGDVVFASPQDLGYFGDRKKGKYTPWRDAANHERFGKDLVSMLERVLAGDAPAPSPAAPGGAAVIDALPERLPEFSAVDLDGRSVASADLLGKPLLVEFWASWCEPCRDTLPFLAALKKEQGDAIRVLTLAVESEEKDIRALSGTIAAGLPVILASPELASLFGDLSAVPTLLLFDREGRAAGVFYGAPPDLHAKVRAALGTLLR